MKSLKIFKSLLGVFLMALMVAAGMQYAAGWSPKATFSGMIGLSIVQSVLAPMLPSGLSMMAVQTELWTGELIKGFRHTANFLSRIGRKNEYVKHNVIHLVDIGADPAVLVNNTTYPIPSAARADGDAVLALNKFDTENTIITDDELHALPYDKPGSVIEQHRLTLEEVSAEMAAHSLCPQANTTNTPVISTTGANNTAAHVRKRLIPADLIAAKKSLDDLKVPLANRELVLCNDHIQDLLLVDETFAKQYKNMKTGEIMDLYGFQISQFVGNPKFSYLTGEKKAFGAADDATNDLATSFFYYQKRAVQAVGDAVMYKADAKNDPKYRQSEIGFRVYHICLPKKDVGFGAIVSTWVS